MARTNGEQKDPYGFEDPEELPALPSRPHQAGRGARRDDPVGRPRCRGFHDAERLSDRDTGLAAHYGELRPCRGEEAARPQTASRLPTAGKSPGQTVGPPWPHRQGRTGRRVNTPRSWPEDESRTGAWNPSAIRSVGRARREHSARAGGSTVHRRQGKAPGRTVPPRWRHRRPPPDRDAAVLQSLGGRARNGRRTPRQSGKLPSSKSSRRGLQPHGFALPDHRDQRMRRDHLFHHSSTETATGGAHP